MTDLTLVGPLAHPAMLQALGVCGEAGQIAGQLSGGLRAGIHRDGWPILAAGPGKLAVTRTPWTPALRRYAEVMELTPQDWHGQQLLGVAAPGPGGASWTAARWLPELAAGVARAILALPADRPARAIARRLPMIAGWAASRLRAATDPRAGIPARRDVSAVRVAARSQPYADYFAVEEWDLSYLRHDGGWSPQVRRAGFIAGDSAVVLPWDPQRDRVLVIEQFRVAPMMRGDSQPWMLEPVAGRIDPGETPDDAARREAIEETGLCLSRLIPAISFYPSPGALGEYLYLFVAPVDLPDETDGIHGLAAEAEDIRSHLMDRAELTRMALAGELPNGPLAMLTLWLAGKAEALRRRAAAT